jgi:CheY-like chemotaxis protein
MSDFNIIEYYNKYKYGDDVLRKLMQYRVKKILLISTVYDAFVFERDALLGEQVFGEYMELNLSSPPEIEAVPTGEEALRLIKTNKYDLVITTLHSGRITPFDVLREVRETQEELPVVLLLTSMSDMSVVDDRMPEDYHFDEIFVWKGDANLFLAVIKSIEDQKNVAYDTRVGLVRVILLVEDSPHFYSLFLPLLYEEIVKQTQHLIIEELNEREKRHRMRARPKVLLAKNYEEAIDIYETYKNNLVAIFTDMSFPRNGVEDKEAGLHLLKTLHKKGSDLATLILSSEIENREKADRADTAFIHKHSKHMLHRLRSFITENLGFGDFVFRDKRGNIIDKAGYLAEFEEKLQNIPDESIVYHAEKNHFSAWLMARGEIELAKNIRRMKMKDFENTDAMKKYLAKKVLEVQKKRNKGEIIKFHQYSLPEENEIILLSEGSLGGKGRGLAFLNTLLTRMDPDKIFEGVHIGLPNTAAIGISEYDIFIEQNRIDAKIHEGMNDDEIDTIFLAGHLSHSLQQKLRRLLERINYPLAVRSSSLLEDSYSQPFAGIYRTYMLANNDQNIDIRLRQLMDAIKLIYASSYSVGTQQYIEHIGHQLDEEKMAVIIQEVVGTKNEDYYYPHISGVAQSYNFYPIDNQLHTDGMASLAVGLGKMVIEGGNVFRFCPRYPKVWLMSMEEMISEAQRELYALDLRSNQMGLYGQESSTLVKLPLSKAEEHGKLKHLASVFDYQNNRLWPGLNRVGPRIVTFDNILKYGFYPLSNIINQLLEIGEAALGMPVEIEFAVDLDRKKGSKKHPTFYLLQIRPLAVSSSNTTVNLNQYPKDDVILYTEQGMGNGEMNNIHDIIWCPPEKFNSMETLNIQLELDLINREMKERGIHYILIGPGRWGTQDRFLGVPIQFGQISQSKVIVESGIKGFDIPPSQGTHFFHNVVAMNIGYFSVPHQSEGMDYINWDLLGSMKKVGKWNYFKHIHSAKPISVKIDGKTGEAIIYIDREMKKDLK